MDINRLMQFKAIAECENMSKAASMLFISQPALSKSLNLLEDELGCQLFERVGRRLRINDNGRTLLRYANQIQGILNEVTGEFEKRRAERVLKVCGRGNYFSFILRNYFRDGVQPIAVNVVSEPKILQALLTGEADVAVTDDLYIRESDDLGLRRIAIISEQLLLSVPKQDPLARRGRVSVKDLPSYQLMRLSNDEETNVWLERIAMKNDVKLKWAMSVDDKTLRYCLDGMGIAAPYYFVSSGAFLHHGSSTAERENRALLRVQGEYTSRMIYLWYLERNKKFLSGFLESVKGVYA